MAPFVVYRVNWQIFLTPKGGWTVSPRRAARFATESSAKYEAQMTRLADARARPLADFLPKA